METPFTRVPIDTDQLIADGETLVKTVGELAESVEQGAQQAAGAAAQATGNVVEDVVEGVGSAAQSAANTGGQAINTVADFLGW